jgi:hypothetical protein
MQPAQPAVESLWYLAILLIDGLGKINTEPEIYFTGKAANVGLTSLFRTILWGLLRNVETIYEGQIVVILDTFAALG